MHFFFFFFPTLPLYSIHYSAYSKLMVHLFVLSFPLFHPHRFSDSSFSCVFQLYLSLSSSPFCVREKEFHSVKISLFLDRLALFPDHFVYIFCAVTCFTVLSYHSVSPLHHIQIQILSPSLSCSSLIIQFYVYQCPKLLFLLEITLFSPLTICLAEM